MVIEHDKKKRPLRKQIKISPMDGEVKNDGFSDGLISIRQIVINGYKML